MSTYDSNKKYQWSPEDQFTLSGEQFGMILNAYRNVLSTPEAGRILMLQQANFIVEEILAKSVENNIVKEVIPQEEKTPLTVKRNEASEV